MARVTVLILHREPGPASGPLTRSLAEARRAQAGRHRRGFLAAGADEVRLIAGPPDDTPFGRRLRRLAAELVATRSSASEPSGLIVLGSGAVPLATLRDLRRFVAVAAAGERRALANSRWSADIVAVGDAAVLAGLPDLDADNALPRWLEEVAGFEVADLARRWHLSVDLDSPADLLLVARDRRAATWMRSSAVALPGPARSRLDAVAERLADPRAEVVVSGRTSAETLRWLEKATAARVRAIVEERGLRASSRLARADAATARPQRAPASVLGRLLDHEGPGALGAILARLGDAALVDTRVLLAHRFGPKERDWPAPEDRFASDLLLPDEVADPWLRELTRSALDAAVPIALGGHTLVGPGARLVASGLLDGSARPVVGHPAGARS